MHKQDKKFKDQWDKVRTKGRLMYSITHGSVFGFVIFILINLFELKNEPIQNVFFTMQAMEQMITMVLAGIIGYGTLKWWINQNMYNKIIAEEKEDL